MWRKKKNAFHTSVWKPKREAVLKSGKADDIAKATAKVHTKKVVDLWLAGEGLEWLRNCCKHSMLSAAETGEVLEAAV